MKYYFTKFAKNGEIGKFSKQKLILVIIYVTVQIASAQQVKSVRTNPHNGPYGVSMSKLMGVWESIDSLKYKIEFSYIKG